MPSEAALQPVHPTIKTPVAREPPGHTLQLRRVVYANHKNPRHISFIDPFNPGGGLRLPTAPARNGGRSHLRRYSHFTASITNATFARQPGRGCVAAHE